MYKFRYLDAHYAVEMKVGHSDGSEHCVCMSFAVVAKYQNEEQRYMISINREKVKLKDSTDDENPAHDVMIELGNALYPVMMYVLADGTIVGVANFEDICKRREAVCQDILRKAYSISTATYIELSKSNFADEKAFIETFCNQIFIQLLFVNPDSDHFEVQLMNLKHAGSTDIMHFKKKISEVGNFAFTASGDAFGESVLEYAISDFGDVLSLNGAFIKSFDEKDVATVNIEITSDMNRRVVKKENKLLSFFID